MNQILNALKHKLSWQLNTVEQQLTALNEQQLTLRDQWTKTQQQLQQTHATTSIIHPEQELARLNFMMQQQQQLDQLNHLQKELDLQQTQLQTRQIRLNTEIHMLQQYEEQQQKTAHHTMILQQQIIADEWSLRQMLTRET